MKLKWFIAGLIGLGAMATFNGCATGNNQNSVKAAPVAYNKQVAQFYPLMVGNKWTYEGSLIGIVTTRTVEITANADGFYTDNSGGALQIDNYGLRDKDGRYLLRGPLTKGTTWTSITAASAVEHYEIIREGKTETTPAGTFHGCLVVKSHSKLSTGDIITNFTTFAPKTGIIRLQTFIQSNGKSIPQSDLLLTAFSSN